MDSNHQYSIETETQERYKNVEVIKTLQNPSPGMRLFNMMAVSVRSREPTAASQLRFLMACPRSGSTLLMRAFAETPDVDVASRVIVMGHETGQFSHRILAQPDTVRAHQRVIEEHAQNSATQSISTFKSLPPPFNYANLRPVFMVRDPIRVYDSWKHHGWTNLESFVERYESLFSLMDKHLTTPFVLVYEKFVRNPAAGMKRISEYWGVDLNTDVSTFKRGYANFTVSSEHEQNLLHHDSSAGLFDTLSSTTHIRSDIPSHNALSREISDIEKRLGRLYLRCWQIELKPVRAYLSHAKWFAFDLDDTLHFFRRASSATISVVLSTIVSESPAPHQITLDELKASYAKVLSSTTATAFVDGKTSHEYREERIRATLAAFPSIDFSPEQMKAWVTLYEKVLMQNLELKPGAVELLTRLKSLGKNIAVITEGPQDAQERTIAQLGLAPFVDFLATSNGFGVSKSEGLIKRVVEKLGSGDIAEFVMVGDNFERDVVPARDLGVFCVHYSEKANFGVSDDGEKVTRVNSLKKLEFLLEQEE